MGKLAISEGMEKGAVILLVSGTKGKTHLLEVCEAAFPEGTGFDELTRHTFPRNIADVATRNVIPGILQSCPKTKQSGYCGAVLVVEVFQRSDLCVSVLADSLPGSNFRWAGNGTVNRDLTVDSHEALLGGVDKIVTRELDSSKRRTQPLVAFQLSHCLILF